MAFRADQPPVSALRPVAITGAGIFTPMGADLAENSAGFRAGRTAFRPVDLFDVSRQRVGTAGVAELPGRVPGVSAKSWQRMDRGSRMAWLAAREALDTAGLTGGDMPVVIGTSAAAMPVGEKYYLQSIANASRRGQLTRVETYQPQFQMMEMMRSLGVRGPLRIVSNACASGANAIGHAFQMVSEGKAERVLAGGYDALCQLVFAGFDSLQALSASGIPRPFDAARDGLALGEGAGFVIVESLESARARGADVLACVLSYAAATDIHHLTQPHPEGDAALTTMDKATRAAGLEPEQIDYINSHGTGTPLNDVAEARAISRWAGESVGKIKVSSTKSAIGHLLGGAGSVESVICLLTLRDQFLPASLNVREIDPVVEFDLVQQPREVPVTTVLTNSFGFGGANATLIFQRDGL
ncbi:beta-ketoacyl-[acyl-carrier-protein] synthase family protein [Luteolibacter flavescens]|uniref:Beta-ketoacyl-[acyl-carrier-protein] synthase family protein n=1 Tax=Luteolibacter flavescens TaxID=1859460 RepID=A0ABT3FQ93_9BACT|nr:beta-ketoacyl-[acyl-carrier-protein] synthase family protein [Luteolibacter flavescens]MCW1885740.1 beta-ketoacyl-[acyl-carrier-protein] synthase family protein [Luteolibacter flavescens]